jgi:hypothetical protein
MKIRDLVGRALVRYFGPADTQAPPKNNQAANPQLAELIEQLQGFNMQARDMLSGQKLSDSALKHDAGILSNPMSADDIMAQLKEQFPHARVTVVDARGARTSGATAAAPERKRPGIEPPDPMP